MKMIQSLKAKLVNALPGHKAHAKVMNHRKSIDQLGVIPEKARQSAVLLLLYPKNKQIHLVFILRSTYKGVHSAQIGLPGGKVEDSDEDLESTAFREAYEELKVDRDKVQVLGKLSPLYVPPSNFVIHPFVGYQATEPNFVPDRFEVAEIIEQRLDDLLQENALIDLVAPVLEGKINTKGFDLQGKVLWGATAMIVQELLEVIRSK